MMGSSFMCALLALLLRLSWLASESNEANYARKPVRCRPPHRTYERTLDDGAMGGSLMLCM